LVVAIAVGSRLRLELQRVGYLQRRGSLGLGRTVQQVHDVRAADDLLFKRRGAGLGHGV
jgi:hypothetical protein